MNTLSLKALAFLASLLLASAVAPSSALACSGHQGTDHSSQMYTARGYLVVHNPNSSRLEVSMDGVLVGEVEAASYAKLGPFAAGDHRVVIRIPKSKLSARRTLAKEVVTIRPWDRSALNLPLFRRAVITIKNRTRRPVDVLVGGKDYGMVEADSKLRVLARQGALVELTSRRGRVLLRETVKAEGLQRQVLRLDPPSRGALRIFNPDRRAAKIFVGGHYLGRLKAQAGSSFLLPLGRHDIEVQFSHLSWDERRIDRRIYRDVEVREHGNSYLELRTRGDGRGGVRAADRAERRSKRMTATKRKGAAHRESSVEKRASSLGSELKG